MEEKRTKFEEAVTTLESVVTQLEAGNLSLDESLALYEKGVKFLRICNQELEKAEQRVLLVKQTGNGTVTEPFVEAEA